ncbi:MAG: glucosamine-6-phosphate deaminase [Microbacterium sp.]
MRITVHRTSRDAADPLAEDIAARVEAGDLRVLGVATGSTPLPLYEALARRRSRGLSDLTLFALDEYVGLPDGHPESYRAVVEREVARPLGIARSRVHVPDAAAPEAYGADIEAHGGIDLQIVGIGVNGHIGFNEPGSSFGSRTRLVSLDDSTRRANARFFSSIDEVPRSAVTQGIGTILRARRIVALAFGEAKAAIVAEAIQGPRTERVPASALRDHPDVEWVLDAAAASRLDVGLESGA